MGNFSRRKTSEKCFRLSTGSLYRLSYLSPVACKVIMGNRARICPFDSSHESLIALRDELGVKEEEEHLFART